MKFTSNSVYMIFHPRLSLAKIWFWTLFLVFLAGCKCYRNIENIKPHTVRETSDSFEEGALRKLVEGDKIRLFTTSGIVYHMHFSKVEEGKVHGLLSKSGYQKLIISEAFEIEVNRIEKMEVYRKSPALTAVVIYFPLVTIGSIILGSFGAGITI